jgi:hypothetical protein
MAVFAVHRPDPHDLRALSCGTQVTVTGPGVRRDVPAGASGAYSVTVPAGRYTVAGRSPLYASGAGLCQAAGAATVTSGHTIKTGVLCQMR